MSGYEIKVSVTALCPSCGKELHASAYCTQARTSDSALERDNPFDRTERRVYILPCSDCFAPRAELNVAAAALRNVREWVADAGERYRLPNSGTLASIDSVLTSVKGGAR
ncbi:TPA: hypothetical protein ACOFCL_000788 [Stenotrophomonas maltophilia]